MSIKLKRSLSWLLSLALIFSMLPTYALGADSGEDPGEEPAIEEPVDSPDGEDVTDPDPDVIDPEGGSDPDEPVVGDGEPAIGEDDPEEGANLGEPIVDPDEPAVDPDEPVVDPDEPIVDPDEPANGEDSEEPSVGEGDDGETPEVPVDPDEGETAEPNLTMAIDSVSLDTDGNWTVKAHTENGEKGDYTSGYVAIIPNVTLTADRTKKSIRKALQDEDITKSTKDVDTLKQKVTEKIGLSSSQYGVIDLAGGETNDNGTAVFTGTMTAYDSLVTSLKNSGFEVNGEIQFVVLLMTQTNPPQLLDTTVKAKGYKAHLVADPAFKQIIAQEGGAQITGLTIKNDVDANSEDYIAEKAVNITYTWEPEGDDEARVVLGTGNPTSLGFDGTSPSINAYYSEKGTAKGKIKITYEGEDSKKAYDPVYIDISILDGEEIVTATTVELSVTTDTTAVTSDPGSTTFTGFFVEGADVTKLAVHKSGSESVSFGDGITATLDLSALPTASVNGYDECIFDEEGSPIELGNNGTGTLSDFITVTVAPGTKGGDYTAILTLPFAPLDDENYMSGANAPDMEQVTIYIVVHVTEGEAPETYTVTWSAGDHGSFNTGKGTMQTGASGTTLTTYGENDLTADEGYEFDGWKDGEGNKVSSFPSTITEDVTYTAQWKPKTYTVTFYDGSTAYGNDTAFKPQTVTHGGTATNPGDPTKTGNRFAGWVDDEGKTFDFATTITADTSVYASWVEQVTLSFSTAHGTAPDSQSGDVNFKATEPTAPSATGWTFGGWSETDGGTTAVAWSYTVAATKTLYAIWTQNEYTAKWYKNEGTWASGDDPQTTTGHYNDALTPPATTLSRTGYTQKGWNTAANGSGTAWSNSAKYPADSNTVYYAQWEADQITVTWDANGGSVSPTFSKGEADSSLTPPTPTRTGYTFTGWYTAATDGTKLGDNPKFPTEDTTYHAHWTPKDITVTWDGNGGGWTTDSTTATTKTTTGKAETDALSAYETDPTRTGYTFKGWGDANNTTEADKVDFTDKKYPTSAKTYYAIWEAITYTVTFDANDGAWGSGESAVTSKTATGTVEDTIASKKPSDPEREGYTFAGWYTEKTNGTQLGTEKFPANNDKVYYAHWTPKQITVTWNGGGGTVSTATTKANAGTTQSVATASRTGYTFTGWTSSDSGITAPGKDDTTFTMPTKDVTFTAQWQINSYNVTFVPNSGTFTTGTSTNTDGNHVVSVEYNKTATVPGISRAGYTLSGWTASVGSNLDASAENTGTITQAVTYTAQWTENSVTVNLKVNDVATNATSDMVFTLKADGKTDIPVTITRGTKTATVSTTASAPVIADTTYTIYYGNKVAGTVAVGTNGSGSGDANFYELEVKVKSGQEAQGSVVGNPTSGTLFVAGEKVDINATANTNYEFVQWNDTYGSTVKKTGEGATGYTYTIAAGGKNIAEAQFKKIAYSGKVKVYVNGTQVTGDTGLTDDVKGVSISGGPDGATPTLTWVSGTGKNYWEMNNLRKDGSYTITVTTPTGKFAKWTWTQLENDDKVVEAKLYTVSVVGGAGNDVTTSGDKDFTSGKDSYFTDKNETAGKTASIVIPAGENITVTANQKTGYTLTGWTKSDNSNLPTGASVTGNNKDTFALTTDYAGTSNLVIKPVYTYELTLKTWYSATATDHADSYNVAPGGTVTATTSTTGANAGTVTAVTGSNGVYTVKNLTPGATYTVSVNGFTSGVTFNNVSTTGVTFSGADVANGVVTVRLYKLTAEVKPAAAAGTASINVGTSASGIIYVPQGAKSGATIYVSASANSGYRLGHSDYGTALWTSDDLTVADGNKNTASTTVTLPTAGASADMKVTANMVKAYQLETAREDTTNGENTVKAAKLTGETAKVTITDNGVLSKVEADMKYDSDSNAIGTVIKVTATIDDGDQVKGWKVTGGKLYSDADCKTELTENSTTTLLGTPTVSETSYVVYFVPNTDLSGTAKVTAVYQFAVYDAKITVKLDGVAQKDVSVKLKQGNTYTEAQKTDDNGEVTFSVGGSASGVNYIIYTDIKNKDAKTYEDSWHTIQVKKEAAEEKVNFFTVSYDLNDADAPTTLADVIVPNNQTTGTVNSGTAPTKAGYVFNGWNKYLWNATGGEAGTGDWNTTATTENMTMSAIASDKVTAKVQYQAQWTANQVTIQARLDNNADATRTGNVQLRATDGTTIIATGKALSSGAVTITSADCASGQKLEAGTTYKIFYELSGTYTDSKNTVTVSAAQTATGYVDFYSVTYDMGSSTNTAPTQTPLLKGQNLTFPNPNPVYNATSVTNEPTFRHWGANSNTDTTAATAVQGISEAKIYYAVWQVEITWDPNEGTITGESADTNKTESLIVGATLTAPTVTRTNYELDTPAWKDGSDNAKPDTVPAANTTYTAQWKEVKHTSTVTVKVDDVAKKDVKVTITNGSESHDATTNASGVASFDVGVKKFAVTTDVTTTNNSGTAVELDVTASGGSAEVNYYTVTFALAGGSAPTGTTGTPYATQTLLSGGTPSAIPEPVRAGYKFLGWNEDNIPNDDISDSDKTTITTTTTYTAQWEANKLTVWVYLDDTNKAHDQTNHLYTDGTTVSLSGTSFSGTLEGGKVEFEGVTAGQTYTVAINGISGTVTTAEITASTDNVCVIDLWTVTFKDALASTEPAWANNPADQTILDGQKATKPTSDPTKAGYVFDDWYETDDGTDDNFDFGEEIETTTDVFAHWTANKLTITVTLDSVTDTAGTLGNLTIDSTEKPLTNGVYEFTPIVADAKHTLGTKNGTGTKEVTGEANATQTVTLNYNTVDFQDALAGTGATWASAPADQYILDANHASKPSSDPTKAGYVFAKWTTDAEGKNEAKFDTTENITANTKTYYAQWTPNTVTVNVTLDGNAYTALGGNAVMDSTTTEALDATTASAKFSGVTVGSHTFTLSEYSGASKTATIAAGDNTVTMPFFTIQFNANAGSDAVGNMPANVVKYTGENYGGTAASETPTRAGYTFLKWTMDAAGNTTANWSQNITAKDGVIYYAQWSEDSNGLTISDVTTGNSITPHAASTDGTKTATNAVTREFNNISGKLGASGKPYKLTLQNKGTTSLDATVELYQFTKATLPKDLTAATWTSYTNLNDNSGSYTYTNDSRNVVTVTGLPTSAVTVPVKGDGESEAAKQAIGTITIDGGAYNVDDVVLVFRVTSHKTGSAAEADTLAPIYYVFDLTVDPLPIVAAEIESKGDSNPRVGDTVQLKDKSNANVTVETSKGTDDKSTASAENLEDYVAADTENSIPASGDIKYQWVRVPADKTVSKADFEVKNGVLGYKQTYITKVEDGMTHTVTHNDLNSNLYLVTYNAGDDCNASEFAVSGPIATRYEAKIYVALDDVKYGPSETDPGYAIEMGGVAAEWNKEGYYTIQLSPAYEYDIYASNYKGSKETVDDDTVDVTVDTGLDFVYKDNKFEETVNYYSFSYAPDITVDSGVANGYSKYLPSSTADGTGTMKNGLTTPKISTDNSNFTAIISDAINTDATTGIKSVAVLKDQYVTINVNGTATDGAESDPKSWSGYQGNHTLTTTNFNVTVYGDSVNSGIVYAASRTGDAIQMTEKKDTLSAELKPVLYTVNFIVQESTGGDKASVKDAKLTVDTTKETGVAEANKVFAGTPASGANHGTTIAFQVPQSEYYTISAEATDANTVLLGYKWLGNDRDKVAMTTTNGTEDWTNINGGNQILIVYASSGLQWLDDSVKSGTFATSSGYNHANLVYGYTAPTHVVQVQNTGNTALSDFHITSTDSTTAPNFTATSMATAKMFTVNSNNRTYLKADGTPSTDNAPVNIDLTAATGVTLPAGAYVEFNIDVVAGKDASDTAYTAKFTATGTYDKKAQTANYDPQYTVAKAPITFVNALGIDAPVADATPDTAADAFEVKTGDDGKLTGSTLYPGASLKGDANTTVTWYVGGLTSTTKQTTDFENGKQYTAEVTLTPGDNYEFVTTHINTVFGNDGSKFEKAADMGYFILDKANADSAVLIRLNENGTLTLRYTFPATAASLSDPIASSILTVDGEKTGSFNSLTITADETNKQDVYYILATVADEDNLTAPSAADILGGTSTATGTTLVSGTNGVAKGSDGNGLYGAVTFSDIKFTGLADGTKYYVFAVAVPHGTNVTDPAEAAKLASNVVSDSFTTPFSVEVKLDGDCGSSSITKPDPNPTYVQAADKKVPTAYVDDGDKGIETGTADLEVIRDTKYVISGAWVDTIAGSNPVENATGEFGTESTSLSTDGTEETITNTYTPKENTVITVNFDGEPQLEISGNASGGKLLNWKYGASASSGNENATDTPSQIVMDPVDDNKYGKVTNTGTKSLDGDATLIVTPKYVWRENEWQLYTDAMFADDLLKVKDDDMAASDLPTSTYFNITLGKTTNTTNTDWKLDAKKYGEIQVLAGAWRQAGDNSWNLETPYKADGTTKTVTDTNRLSAAWAQAHQPSSKTDRGNGADGYAKDYNVSYTTDENGNEVGIYQGILRAYDAGSYTLFDSYNFDENSTDATISLEIRVVDEGWAGNPKDWVWDLNPRSHGRNESGNVVEDTYTDSTRSVAMTHKDWDMDINTGGYNSGSTLEAVAGQFGSTAVNTRTGKEENSWNTSGRTYTFTQDTTTATNDYKLEHRATATTDADIYDFAFHVKTLRDLAYTGFKKDVGVSSPDYYLPDSGDWADFDLTLSDTNTGKTNTKTINLSFIDTRPGLKVKKLTQSGTAVTATIETIQHDNGPTAAPEYKTHNNLTLYGENGTTDYTGAKGWLKNGTYDAHVRWYSVTPDQKAAIEALTTAQAKFDYLKALNSSTQLVKQSSSSNEGTGVLTYNYQTSDIGNYLYCTVEGDNVWFRDVAVSAAQYIAPTLTVKALRNGDHVANTTDYRVEVKSNKVAGDDLTTTGTTATLGTTTAGVGIANKTLTFTKPGEVFTLKTNQQDTAKNYFFTNWSDVLTNVKSNGAKDIEKANGTYTAKNTDLTATLTASASADTTLIAYYDLLPTLGAQADEYDLGSADVPANRTLAYTQHDGSGNVTVTIVPAKGHKFADNSVTEKTLTIGTGKDCTLAPNGDTAANLVLDETWVKDNLILNGLSDGVYTITVKDNEKSTTANGNIYDVSTTFTVTRAEAHIVLRVEEVEVAEDVKDYFGEVEITDGKNMTGPSNTEDTPPNPESSADANITNGTIDPVTLNAYPDVGYAFDKWVIVTGEKNADGTDKVIEISNNGQTVTNYGKFGATTSRNTGDGSVKATFTAFIPEVTIEARFKPIDPTNGSGTAQKGSDTISPNTDVKYTDGRTDTTKKYEVPTNDDGTAILPDWLEINESTGHIDIKAGHTVPDDVDGLVDGKLTIPVTITITKGGDSIQKPATYTLTITDKTPTPSGGGGGGGEECPNKVYYWLGLDGTTSDATIEDVYTGSNPSHIPSVTALNGLTFKGWSLTKPEAGKTVTLVDPKTVEIKKDTTFYAVYELVERPYHEHYVIGYPNGNFGPADNINRASVATIIARAVLPDFVEGADYGNPGGYSDVSGHWAESAIAYCSKFGVFEGYLDGTFKPDQYITRQEFALVIARIDGLLACGDLPFDDADEIGSWALDGVYTAFEKGWVNGYTDGTFRPNSYIRRDETVKVFNAYLNRGVDKDGLSELKEYVHSGVASNNNENGTDEYMTWPDVPKTQWAYYEIIEAANDHEYEVASDGSYTVPEHWTKCWIDEKWRYHDDLNDGGHTDAADRVEANTNIVGKQ